MSAVERASLPASCSRLAAPAAFEIWRVDLRREPSTDELELLDHGERERAARFVFEPLRRRYRTAHVALRSLLAQRDGQDPAALRFDQGLHGKPRLVGRADAPAFNLSDSDDIALIAIASEGDIGIDVERLRLVSDPLGLASAHFCPREAAWLAAATDRDRAFLRVWVAKEACLKAIGSGLSIPAASFDAGLVGPVAARPARGEATWLRVAIPTTDGTANVELTEFDAGADCVAALARRVRASHP